MPTVTRGQVVHCIELGEQSDFHSRNAILHLDTAMAAHIEFILRSEGILVTRDMGNHSFIFIKPLTKDYINIHITNDILEGYEKSFKEFHLGHFFDLHLRTRGDLCNVPPSQWPPMIRSGLR